MTQAQAGVRQSTRLILTLRRLWLADATSRHHRQTLCAVWQALPREPDVPMEERGCHLRGLWPPLQAPCSSSLHSRLCSVPGQGKTPGLPVLSPDCPRASKDRITPIALGFLVPTGPELWVVHGRPRAPVLVPNACRDGCRWVNPSLVWLSCCCPSLTGNQKAARLQEPPRQPNSTWFHSPCMLHLVPSAGLWPLEPAVSMSCHGQPGPVKPFAQH